jgi:hypothetical protein
MRAFRLLGPLAAAGCSGDTGREPTAAEQSIIDRLGEAPGEETDPAETEAARNGFVAECMAEAELEYLGPTEAPSLIEWLGLTAEQFAAEYGFGDIAVAQERQQSNTCNDNGTYGGQLRDVRPGDGYSAKVRFKEGDFNSVVFATTSSAWQNYTYVEKTPTRRPATGARRSTRTRHTDPTSTT